MAGNFLWFIASSQPIFCLSLVIIVNYVSVSKTSKHWTQ